MTAELRTAVLVATLAAIAALGACEHGHQQVVALRMVRPAPAPAGLRAYAAADPDDPTVGGDILRGTSSRSGAAYEATTGDYPPPAPPVDETPRR